MVQYTVFPGRGGTPLQPQEFYIQTYVLVSPPFSQADWLSSSRSLPTAQSFDPPNLLLTTLAPPVVNYIFRAPIFVKIPILPKAGGEVAGTLNALLTPNPPQPFVQSDWPRSIDGKQTIKQEYAVNTLPFQSMAPTGVPPAPLVDQPAGGARPKAIVDPVGPIASLLTPNPPQPFAQRDWLRQPALPKAIGEVVGTLSPLLTPNPSRPFSQADWFQILPRQKAKVDDPLNLTPFLPAPVVTVQFNQLDWPRVATPLPVAKPTDQQNLLTSTLAPAVVVVNYVYRTPIFARLPDPWAKAKVDDPFNLTIYLPTVIVAVAFKQLDWPLPARPPTKQPDTSAAASAPLYTPNPPRPFVQSLWDSATRGFPKVVGEVVGTLSPLLTPNPSAPFNQYEWRTTARVPLSLKSDVYFGALSLFSPNPPIPFNQDLWENAARTPPRAVGEPVAGISALLTPNPSQPFNQSDWFQIRSTQKAKVDDPGNLTIYLPTVVVQFSQLDWPNPPLARMKIGGDFSVAGPQPLYSPNPAQPFFQGLWEGAAKSWSKVVGEPMGGVAPLLTPNPSRPFSQSDWPSAVAAKPLAKVDTVSLLLPVYSPPRPFTNSTETRTFAFQIVKSDIHVNLLPLHTPPPIPFPFNQGDWPLPHSAGAVDRSFTYRSQFIPAFVPPIAAQYFLLQPHYIKDVYLQAWTIVTEGIEIPFGWVPTLMVDPLNQQAVNAFYAAGPRPGYPGPGYDWQGWQYLTSQRQASIQSPNTFWKQTSPGMFSLTGLGSSLPPVGV